MYHAILFAFQTSKLQEETTRLSVLVRSLQVKYATLQAETGDDGARKTTVEAVGTVRKENPVTSRGTVT